MLVLLMIRLPLFHDHGDHAYHDDHAQEAVPQEVCQMRKVQQASYSGHSQRTSDTTLLPALLRASIQHKWVFPWVIRGHSYSRGHRKARGRGEGSVGEGGEGQEGEEVSLLRDEGIP